MKWRKLGRIIVPGRFDWMVTHAQNPFAEHVEGDMFRIHFAGRDEFNRARGGYVTININRPLTVLDQPSSPSLDLGERGCFDDCGVMPSCLVANGARQHMYYTGWTRAVNVPFLFFIGLVVSDDGGLTYRRASKAPVLGRGLHDPYLTGSPWVLVENGVWRMWYVSCTGWKKVSGSGENVPCSIKNEHCYHICYAESKDGVAWKTDGTVCIDYRKDEYAIARPVVHHQEGLYSMWYCHRGGNRTYRAGYAESKDGIQWTRKDDEVGIDVSPNPDDWDAHMICYPCVFKHQGQTYMLYNGGKNYGDTGCGLARLE